MEYHPPLLLGGNSSASASQSQPRMSTPSDAGNTSLMEKYGLDRSEKKIAKVGTKKNVSSKNNASMSRGSNNSTNNSATAKKKTGH